MKILKTEDGDIINVKGFVAFFKNKKSPQWCGPYYINLVTPSREYEFTYKSEKERDQISLEIEQWLVNDKEIYEIKNFSVF